MGRRGTDLAVSVTLTPEREGGADGVESLMGSEAADGNGPYSLMPDGEGGRRWEEGANLLAAAQEQVRC